MRSHGHSKFGLQYDTEASKVKSNTVSKYWWHAYKSSLQNCQQMQNFKICKIEIQGLFKDFQVLSSTLSLFKHFQGPWSFYSKFKDFSSTLWTLYTAHALHTSLTVSVLRLIQAEEENYEIHRSTVFLKPTQWLRGAVMSDECGVKIFA